MIWDGSSFESLLKSFPGLRALIRAAGAFSDGSALEPSFGRGLFLAQYVVRNLKLKAEARSMDVVKAGSITN